MTASRDRLALGVGCERDTAPEELERLVRHTLRRHAIAESAIEAVCSIDSRGREAAVLALAARLNVPARFFSAATLERETPRLANPSAVVFAATGCHGVAEGAALAAAGPRGRLVVPKQKSAHATCAIAAFGDEGGAR